MEAAIRQDMGGATVDAGAALALAREYGVAGPAAAHLVTQAARGIMAGTAKRGEASPEGEADG